MVDSTAITTRTHLRPESLRRRLLPRRSLKREEVTGQSLSGGIVAAVVREGSRGRGLNPSQ
jgi:hypothetical protein